MDGKVIIGTEIDTSGIDKGLKEIEEKAKKTTIVGHPGFLTEEEKRLDKIAEKQDKLKEKQQALADLDLDNWGYDYEDQINALIDKMVRAQIQINRLTEKGDKYGALPELKAGLSDMLNKYASLKEKQEALIYGEEEIDKKIKKHDNVLGNIIKKVGKWALAIVGIRSVYSGIRRAISMVSAQSESVANQMKVMTTAVANALTPLVSKIMNIIAQIMMYIDYIYFRLTSKHLFDFSKAFADANKNAKGTEKSVGKMTASFDEMNVLQNNSSGGGGGGISATDNPFKDWQNFKPPKWLDTITKVLKWIKDNWKAIAIGVAAIGLAFLAFNLFKGGGAKEVVDGITGLGPAFGSLLQSLGTATIIIAILGGFALVIREIANLLDVFANSGLKVGDVLGLLGTIVASLTILITALTIASQALQSPLAMAGLAVLTASICAILLVVAETLPTILDALGKFLQSVAPVLIEVLDTIGVNIEKIIYALGTTLPPIINSVGGLFDTIFTGISKVVSTVGGTIVSILREAGNLTDRVLSGILRFIRELGPAINVFVDNAIKAVTKLINFIVSGIEYLINTLIVNAVNKIIDSINSVGDHVGFTIPRVRMMSIPRFRPRLAKGGIVNMPGKGVPVGGAIAGERGPEAVLPLTDSQQMALLGEAIGKYITINANITNTMNGRVISRELQRVQNENDFAYNR